jgi:hypothetical protein
MREAAAEKLETTVAQPQQDFQAALAEQQIQRYRTKPSGEIAN